MRWWEDNSASEPTKCYHGYHWLSTFCKYRIHTEFCALEISGDLRWWLQNRLCCFSKAPPFRGSGGFRNVVTLSPRFMRGLQLPPIATRQPCRVAIVFVVLPVVASFWGTEMIRFLGPEGKPRSTVLIQIVNFVGGWNTAWYVKGRFCRELLNMMNMSKCHFQPQFIVDKRHGAHRGTYGLWYALMHHDITRIIISQTPTYWNILKDIELHGTKLQKMSTLRLLRLKMPGWNISWRSVIALQIFVADGWE